MKEVEIFGTKFTIPDEWTVEYVENDENNVRFKFKEIPPDQDGSRYVFITRLPGILSGTTDVSYALQSLEINKNTSLQYKIFNAPEAEEVYYLAKTPVIHLTTTANTVHGDLKHEIFYFYTDYNNGLLVQYAYRPDVDKMDYSGIVKDMIDKAEYPFEGFGQKKQSQKTSSSKKACDGTPYGSGSDWAKYDKNGDGCINDNEFQAGMGDAVEERMKN